MSLMREAQPVILHKDEGTTVILGGGSQRCIYKLTGSDTINHFGLYEVTMKPRAMGASPHIHRELVEMFYVLEGQMDLLAGDKRVIGRPGSLVSVPPDIVHAFANAGDDPARFLLMFCPGAAREAYFNAMAELTKNGQPPDREIKAALDERFDTIRASGVKFP